MTIEELVNDLYKDNYSVSPAEVINLLRKVIKMKECKECGELFEPKRKEQKFCSHKCSVKFNRRSFSFASGGR